MEYMIEQFDSTPKPKLPPLDEMVKGVLTPSGIGDTRNNFAAYSLWLAEPSFWPRVRHAQTYEEYIGETYRNFPGLVAAVIAASDKPFVEAYDTIVQRVNIAIGTGVTSQEQASVVGSIVKEANALIDNYCRTLRSGV